MFDEPFWDRPDCNTWGYRLLDSLLYLVVSLFWWLLYYVATVSVGACEGTSHSESERK